ncbi:hypothetical protein [Pseudomaricurvus sp.]|uniref:hypothetical protein n=1 Tax=Pseudomaricurvus sp. TaxID=2004510 RepID=UPI003F6B63F6
MKALMNACSQRLVQWLLLFGLCVLVGYGQQQYSRLQQIETALSQQLPARVRETFSDLYSNDDPEPLIVSRINEDLARSGSQERVQACVIELIALNSPDNQAWWPFGQQLAISWQWDERQYRSLLSVGCQTQMPQLLGTGLLLSLGLMGLICLLPGPISAARQQWMSRLLQEGSSLVQGYAVTSEVDRLNPAQQQSLWTLVDSEVCTARQALVSFSPLLLSDLSEDQLDWLQVGLRQSNGNFETALQVARSENRLVFDIVGGGLTVHGVPLSLPRTPYFYYLWYASLRLQTEGAENGWTINPSVQRPDHQAAEQLIEWMEQADGHRKAINDLKQNGLRAKTLDQNRNKIKEELVSLLGETLAAPFLFETERDPKTGRSRYRLALPASKIEIRETSESVKR